MATTARVALDSGAVIALSRGDAKMRALLRELVLEGSVVLIPVPVLVETLRGGAKDAPVERVLKNAAMQFIPVSESAARNAGRLLGACKLPPSEGMDALIVATALEAGATLLVTCDYRHTSALVGHAANVIGL
jgi:predicted nucleic acid-binding protein